MKYKKTSQFYLSFAAANQLKEWGCKIEIKHTPFFFWKINGEIEDEPISFKDIDDMKKADMEHDGFTADCVAICPAYHILEDICVTHAKEFFGESQRAFQRVAYQENPIWLLHLLRQGKKSEAEAFFLENTVFNPKNHDS